jgi:hypothetical protein
MNAFVPGLLTSGLACISGRGLNMLARRSGRKPFNAAQSKWRKNQKLSLGRESAVFELHTFDAHPEGGGDQSFIERPKLARLPGRCRRKRDCVAAAPAAG